VNRTLSQKKRKGRALVEKKSQWHRMGPLFDLLKGSHNAKGGPATRPGLLWSGPYYEVRKNLWLIRKKNR